MTERALQFNEERKFNKKYWKNWFSYGINESGSVSHILYKK